MENGLSWEADATDFLKTNKKLFDLVAFCYTHFPGPARVSAHKQLASLVPPGGHVIFEAFAKGHERYNAKHPEVGGPKDPAMLFNEAEIHAVFEGFEFLELNTQEVSLAEGKYHQGIGLVVRAFAVKR